LSAAVSNSCTRAFCPYIKGSQFKTRVNDTNLFLNDEFFGF